MKTTLRNIFAPLLGMFEKGSEPFSYKQSHRTILIVLGCLFLFLSIVATALGVSFGQIGALIPALVFLGVAVTALVVGTLGSDRAVSKIWGSK